MDSLNEMPTADHLLYKLRLCEEQVFATHRALQPLWPTVPQTAITPPRQVASLADVAADFDALVLDGYGVLNIGQQAIADMPDVLAKRQQAGQPMLVISNGSSQESAVGVERYRQFGYHFCRDNFISSRDALRYYLQQQLQTWRLDVIASDDSGLEQLPLQHCPRRLRGGEKKLGDALLLLSSAQWDADQQHWLRNILCQQRRPLLVANPDVSAPLFEAGQFSAEPGWLAWDLYQHCAIRPIFFGKPFALVYQLARRRLQQLCGGTLPARILMVGDTPFTDILGARRVGWHSALMTDHGLLRDHPWQQLLAQSAIWPDIIIGSRAA